LRIFQYADIGPQTTFECSKLVNLKHLFSEFTCFRHIPWEIVTNLESLECTFPFPDREIPKLAELPNLKKLGCNSNHLPSLLLLTNLVSLRCAKADGMEEELRKKLKNLTYLCFLNEDTFISFPGKNLSKYGNLKTYHTPPQLDLEKLRKMTNLESLIVVDPIFDELSEFHHVLSELTNLVKLQALEVPIPDKVIEGLRKLTKLARLSTSDATTAHEDWEF